MASDRSSAGRRPWRVFVSHTQELAEHPAGGSFVDAAERALKRAEHLGVEMDAWTASPDTPRAVCEQKVRSCDVYVGIFGFRWGSPARDDPNRSYLGGFEPEARCDPSNTAISVWPLADPLLDWEVLT